MVAPNFDPLINFFLGLVAIGLVGGLVWALSAFLNSITRTGQVRFTLRHLFGVVTAVAVLVYLFGPDRGTNNLLGHLSDQPSASISSIRIVRNGKDVRCRNPQSLNFIESAMKKSSYDPVTADGVKFTATFTFNDGTSACTPIFLSSVSATCGIGLSIKSDGPLEPEWPTRFVPFKAEPPKEVREMIDFLISDKTSGDLVIE